MAGAALNTFLSAIVSLVMLFNDQSTYAILNWLWGDCPDGVGRSCGRACSTFV
jgi:ABC-type Fe3+-siderophore transport system permease subunit